MVYLSICCVIFDFFDQYLIVFEYRSFVSLARFIPKHFIIFDAMVNGIVFLMSLIFCS